MAEDQVNSQADPWAELAGLTTRLRVRANNQPGLPQSQRADLRRVAANGNRLADRLREVVPGMPPFPAAKLPDPKPFRAPPAPNLKASPPPQRGEGATSTSSQALAQAYKAADPARKMEPTREARGAVPPLPKKNPAV